MILKNSLCNNMKEKFKIQKLNGARKLKKIKK
jgi:hypothetical protein